MIGGRYQLVDVVAEGGLSTVWQGVARSSEVFARPVAIKVMKRAFSTVGGPYLSMFLEEARIGARLQHSNVIQVLDFIVEATPAGPTYCLVMEWVDGIDLRTMLRVETAMGRKLFAEGEDAYGTLELVEAVPTTTGVIITTYRPTA